MNKIMLPTSFERFTNNSKSVEVAGENVEQVLHELTVLFPELRTILFTDANQIQRFVNVFVDKEDIRSLNGLKTPLEKGGIVSLVVAVAGG